MREHTAEEVGMSKKVSINLLDGAKTAVGCRISRGQLTPALSAVKTGSGVPSFFEGAYSYSTVIFFAFTAISISAKEGE